MPSGRWPLGRFVVVSSLILAGLIAAGAVFTLVRTSDQPVAEPVPLVRVAKCSTAK